MMITAFCSSVYKVLPLKSLFGIMQVSIKGVKAISRRSHRKSELRSMFLKGKHVLANRKLRARRIQRSLRPANPLANSFLSSHLPTH